MCCPSLNIRDCLSLSLLPSCRYLVFRTWHFGLPPCGSSGRRHPGSVVKVIPCKMQFCLLTSMHPCSAVTHLQTTCFCYPRKIPAVSTPVLCPSPHPELFQISCCYSSCLCLSIRHNSMFSRSPSLWLITYRLSEPFEVTPRCDFLHT